MKKNAHEILNEIKKYKTLWAKKISGVKILKDKYILGKKYKITCRIYFASGNPKSAIAELHDDKTYFFRSLFALRKLKNLRVEKKSLVPDLLWAHTAKKIVLREDVRGIPLNQILETAGISEKQKAEILTKLGFWIACVHSFSQKQIPQPLKIPLNLKLEEKILKKTLGFLVPNLKPLKLKISKNLSKLLSCMKREKKLCLTHGDFQVSNIYVSQNSIKILDFDTLEYGHPGRDIGRFLAQIDETVPKKNEIYKKIFLKSYFLKSPYSRAEIQKNIFLHQIEMMQYIILGEVWGKKYANPKSIKGLLQKQDALFSKI